jgi:hypothetical protein
VGRISGIGLMDVIVRARPKGEWLQNGMRITPFAALSCDNRTESIGSNALSTVLLSAIKAGGGASVKISPLKIRAAGPSKDEERPRPVLKFHPPSPARTRATSGNKKLFLNYAHIGRCGRNFILAVGTGLLICIMCIASGAGENCARGGCRVVSFEGICKKANYPRKLCTL